MDYDAWFNGNIEASKKVYQSMSKDFHRWFYDYCGKHNINVKESDSINATIDQAIMARMGLAEDVIINGGSHGSGRSQVGDIISDIMYGIAPKSLNSILKRFIIACKNNKDIDRCFAHSFHQQLQENANTKLEYLKI